MAGLVELLILIIQILTMALMGILGWLGKRYSKKVKENTRFRRAVDGDEDYGDGGRLDEFADLHEQLSNDHQEVREWLINVDRRVRAVADAINRSELDVEVDETNDRDYPVTDD